MHLTPLISPNLCQLVTFRFEAFLLALVFKCFLVKITPQGVCLGCCACLSVCGGVLSEFCSWVRKLDLLLLGLWKGDTLHWEWGGNVDQVLLGHTSLPD